MWIVPISGQTKPYYLKDCEIGEEKVITPILEKIISRNFDYILLFTNRTKPRIVLFEFVIVNESLYSTFNN